MSNVHNICSDMMDKGCKPALSFINRLSMFNDVMRVINIFGHIISNNFLDNNDYNIIAKAIEVNPQIRLLD